MKNTLQKKLYENGYSIVKNILREKRLKKFLTSILKKNILLFQNLISMIWTNILIQDYRETT